MSNFESINGPMTFGQAFAKEFMLSGALDGFDENQSEIDRRLVEIDSHAEELQLLNNDYFVVTRLAFSIPVSIDADDPSVSHIRFNDGITFKGELVTHSSVKIGRLIGGNAVRAFCLTFNKVTLLPYFDEIHDDHLMHVPAYAIQDIDLLQHS